MREQYDTQLPIDIQKILQLIPHRYPFILVDRVTDITVGESIVALKNVSMGEPYFQGHFPEKPVMPGVLILEGLAQAGAILAYLTEQEMIGEKLVYFAGLDKVRFRKVVHPGDQLIFKLKLVKHKTRLIKMEAHAYVNDELVTEATLLATSS